MPGPKRAPRSLGGDLHELRTRPSEEIPVPSLQAAAVEAPETHTRIAGQQRRSTAAVTADPVVQEAQTIRTQFSLHRPAPWSSQAGREARFYGGLVGLFVVHVTIWLALWSVVPALAFGWSPLVLTSDSMAPTLRTGDVVIAAPHDGSVLGPGTVVLFDNAAGTGQVTHRIVSVGEDGTYITRGDANRLQDSTPLPAENVVGVGRILVPLIGSPLVWWWTGTWWKVALWLAGIVFCLWLARYALFPAFAPWGPQPEAT
jgi:signal peptidase